MALVQQAARLVGLGRAQALVPKLVRQLGVVGEHPGYVGKVPAALGQGLARVARFQQGELCAVLGDELAEPSDNRAALGWRKPRPRALVKGAASRGDGGPRVNAVALGYLGELRLVKGVDDATERARSRARPRPVDEQGMGPTVGVDERPPSCLLQLPRGDRSRPALAAAACCPG